jgi:hypothetical protein
MNLVSPNLVGETPEELDFPPVEGAVVTAGAVHDGKQPGHDEEQAQHHSGFA